MSFRSPLAGSEGASSRMESTRLTPRGAVGAAAGAGDDGLVHLESMQKAYTASHQREAHLEEMEAEKKRIEEQKLQKSVDMQELRNLKAKTQFAKVEMANKGMLSISDDPTKGVEIAKKVEETTGVMQRASFAWRRIEATTAPLSSPPSARSGHSCFTFGPNDPRFFVHGGAADATYMDDMYYFHTVQERWTKLHTFYPPSARSYHTSLMVAPMPGSTSSKGRVPRLFTYGGYFKGGLSRTVSILNQWEVAIDGYDGASKVYIYKEREHPPKNDPDRNKWDEQVGHGDVPIARCNHTANVIAGRYVIVFGGWLGKFVNDVYVVDTTTFKWEYKATKLSADNPTSDLPKPRAGHTATMLPGRRLLIFGGQGENGQLGDLAVLDIPTMTWMRPRPLGFGPSVRSGHTACYDQTQEKIFFFGGWDGIRLRNDVAVLNVKGDMYTEWNWEHVSVYGKIEGRVGHSAALVGSRMYVFGGWTEAGDFTSEVHVLETSRARRAFVEAAKKARLFSAEKIAQLASVVTEAEERDKEIEEARLAMEQLKASQLTEEQKAKQREEEEARKFDEKVDSELQRARNLIMNRTYLIQSRAAKAEKDRKQQRNRILANLRRAYVESSVRAGYSLTDSMEQMKDISDENLLRYIEAAEMGAAPAPRDDGGGGASTGAAAPEDASKAVVVADASVPQTEGETIESAVRLMTGSRPILKAQPPPPLERALDHEDYLAAAAAKAAAARERSTMSAEERAMHSAFDAVRTHGTAAAGVLRPGTKRGGMATAAQFGSITQSMIASPRRDAGADALALAYNPSPLTAAERAMLPESQRIALERTERMEALERIAAGGGVENAYADIEEEHERQRQHSMRLSARQSVLSMDQNALEGNAGSPESSPRRDSKNISDRLRAGANEHRKAAAAAAAAQREAESQSKLGPALQAALAARRDHEFTLGAGSQVAEGPLPAPPPKVVPRPRRHYVANTSDEEYMNALIEGREAKPLPVPVPAAQAKALVAPSSVDTVEHTLRTARLSMAYRAATRKGMAQAMEDGDIPVGVANSVAVMQAAIRGFLERRRLRAARAATRIQAMIRGVRDRRRVAELQKMLGAALTTGLAMKSFVRNKNRSDRKKLVIPATAEDSFVGASTVSMRRMQSRLQGSKSGRSILNRSFSEPQGR